MTDPQQTESISSKMRKKTRVLTLATIIQHSFGNPYHGNQRRKRNKEFRLEKKEVKVCFQIAAAAKSLQSCPTLCDPRDGSPPGSAVPGTLQARTLEWVAISFSNAWKWKVKVKPLSRVRLLATPWTACSLSGSSVNGIFQARVLEWGAIAFSVFRLHDTNHRKP